MALRELSKLLLKIEGMGRSHVERDLESKASTLPSRPQSSHLDLDDGVEECGCPMNTGLDPQLFVSAPRNSC